MSAPVDQLDRSSDSESEGCPFESGRAHQFPRITLDDTTYPPRYVAGDAIFDTLLDAVCAVGTPVNLAETDIGYRLFGERRIWNARRIFGTPDFMHRVWDLRALTDIAPDDVVVFADGTENDTPRTQSHDDSALFADPSRVLP